MTAVGQTILGLFVTADRDLLAWIAALSFFLSLAAVALLVRRRSWLEMIIAFLITFFVILTAAQLFFKHVIGVPILKAETVRIDTN